MATTNFEPPPTWAPVILETVDPASGGKTGTFNPVWLKWFLDLAALLSAAGGGSGALGNVTGPAVAVLNHLATFADTTGKVIKDGGPIPVVPSFSDNETPTGVVNGLNGSFTLAHTPSPLASVLFILSNGAGTTKVYVQGTDYTMAGAVATFTTIPAPAGAALRAFYRF